MKIIRDKKTKLAIYVFSDDEAVSLTDDSLSGPVIALDINKASHEVVNGPAPEVWIPGALKFDGSWSVCDQDRYTEGLEEYSRREALDVQRKQREDVMKAAAEATQADADAKATLREIDISKIRSMSEFLLAKFGADPLMPKDAEGKVVLAQLDSQAISEREKLTSKV